MRSSVILILTSLFLLSCRSTTKTAGNEENVPQFTTNMRQLTFDGRRAGEGYFSRDGQQMVFQSERESDNPFYQIYLLDMRSGSTRRISPGKGKTTCAWIKPDGKKILFASTHHDPESAKKAMAEWEERKNPKSKYSWSFDDAYEIYETDMFGKNPRNLTRAKGYDAEGSYSPDGQWIAFASNRAAYDGKMTPEQQQAFARDASVMMDLYIMRADGSGVKRLTTHFGYDGGPFFSPDGKRLTFRRFAPDGHSAEVYTINVDGTDERKITDLKAMSWAPFYHPSGDYLIFATNKNGYANFELYIVDVNGQRPAVRATNLPGFDGLPVFTPDGKGLAWTHSNERGEAQIYRADWNDALAREKLGLAQAVPAPQGAALPDLTSNSKRWVEYLAQEKFAGRMTGGPTEPEYTETLAAEFRKLGLKPVSGESFIQIYEFVRGVKLEDGNTLTFKIDGNAEVIKVGADWIPLSFALNGDYPNAGAAFAGYAIVAPENGKLPAYDSYANLDVKDKWVVAFNGLPEDVENERRFQLHAYSSPQHKAMMARQRGARGLILVGDTRAPEIPIKLVFDGRSEQAGIPVLRVSNAAGDKLFAALGATRAEWTRKLASGKIENAAIPKVDIEAAIRLSPEKGIARNVMAKLEAPGATWTTMIGAHLDHLGQGEGGNSLSKTKNVIHYGADDNASGVAGVMQIAHALSQRTKNGGLKLKQNVIFALWTGEEIGVLGSSHFAKSLAKPGAPRISAYINMDMIGRFTDHVLVQGVGSAKEWRSLIERNNMRSPMNVRMQEDPYLPTDSLPFYMKKIPAISFFTGSHAQYHTGEDKPELLNYPALEKIARWIEELTILNAQAPRPLLTYQKVEGGKNPTSGSRGFRLYLGTIPDYAQESGKGVKITGTSKDSPAEKAGVQPGDTIVELGGMKIQNLHDYAYCLQALKADQKIKMKVVRSGLEKELEITPVLKTQQ